MNSMIEPTKKHVTVQIDPAACARWLQKHNNYLILCHANPDADTLGCGIGLMEMLRLMGKRAYCICASFIPHRLSFLCEERSTMLLEQLPSDFFWDKIISVDVAAPSLLGSYAVPFGEDGYSDLAIDHHGTHAGFAKQTCLAPTFAACTELIFDIGSEIFAWNETDRPIPKQIAMPLYAGLSTDSGSFKFGAVTPQTHHRAAALLASGMAHTAVTERLYGSKPLSAVMAAKAAYEDLRFFFDNRVSLVSFTEETMKRYRLHDEDIDDVINLIRSIQGVCIAVHIKPRGENTYKISMRSIEGYDVCSVCASFGGGGHPCAAGCTVIAEDAAQVEQRILARIGEVLNETEG